MTDWETTRDATLVAMTDAERAAYDDAAQAADIRLVVADLVYNARADAGLTQTELGRLAGTSQAVISAIENAAQLPTVVMLDRIARALGGHLQIQLTTEPPAA